MPTYRPRSRTGDAAHSASDITSPTTPRLAVCGASGMCRYLQRVGRGSARRQRLGEPDIARLDDGRASSRRRSSPPERRRRAARNARLCHRRLVASSSSWPPTGRGVSEWLLRHQFSGLPLQSGRCRRSRTPAVDNRTPNSAPRAPATIRSTTPSSSSEPTSTSRGTPTGSASWAPATRHNWSRSPTSCRPLGRIR